MQPNQNPKSLSFFARSTRGLVLFALLLTGAASSLGGDKPDSQKELPYSGIVSGALPLPALDVLLQLPTAPDGYEVTEDIVMQQVSSHLGRGVQTAGGARLSLTDIFALQVVVETVTVAANGDTLFVSSTLVATDWFSGVPFAYEGDYTISGGTGRFKQATGTGMIGGMAEIEWINNAPASLAFTHEFRGTIGYTASDRGQGGAKNGKP